jgi:3-hydroxyacyl-CoA dehydrogenase
MNAIKTVAVVGSGVMGRRIAYACIISGFQTRVFDISTEITAAALDEIADIKLNTYSVFGFILFGNCLPSRYACTQ